MVTSGLCRAICREHQPPGPARLMDHWQLCLVTTCRIHRWLAANWPPGRVNLGRISVSERSVDWRRSGVCLILSNIIKDFSLHFKNIESLRSKLYKKKTPFFVDMVYTEKSLCLIIMNTLPPLLHHCTSWMLFVSYKLEYNQIISRDGWK